MAPETVFYIVGGVLVVLALVVSYIGVRGKDSFPPSRGAMLGGLAVVGAVVVATAAYAVAGAREEQEHREHEQAEEEAHAEELEREDAADAGAAPAAQGKQGEGASGTPPEGASSEPLAVSSPEDGSLAFDPPDLQAPAGNITLGYDNPSLITHNIFLQDEEETVVAESDDVAEGTVEVTAELTPGEYIYYCDIPGHREGGMEGVLTVQ